MMYNDILYRISQLCVKPFNFYFVITNAGLLIFCVADEFNNTLLIMNLATCCKSLPTNIFETAQM